MGWMLELAVSRQREFLADASAAEMNTLPRRIGQRIKEDFWRYRRSSIRQSRNPTNVYCQPAEATERAKRLDEHPPERRRENPMR